MKRPWTSLWREYWEDKHRAIEAIAGERSGEEFSGRLYRTASTQAAARMGRCGRAGVEIKKPTAIWAGALNLRAERVL